MHVEEGESQLGIPVREIKGIGEKTEKLLAKLDIETVDQLVHHYPRCYTTYPEPISISEINFVPGLSQMSADSFLCAGLICHIFEIH